jgi:tetratricopeptide (TPR) repeat protein
VAALLVCLVCAAYAGSLKNGPVWDDTSLVTDNPFLRSVDGLLTLWKTDLWTASEKREPSSFYRPLTMVTFWVNAQITGQSAAAMRLGNILLHAANAVLMLLLLRKLLEPPKLLVASLLAMLWAVLAINSEPIFWISGRFDPLVAMAALLCVLANRLEGWRRTIVVTACVVAGLLFKEAFMGWLPMLLLDDWLLLRRRTRDIWPKHACIGLAVALNLLLRKTVGIISLSVLSETGVRTLAEAYLFTFATLIPRAFVPFGLDPFHPYAPLPIVQSVALGVAVVTVSGVLAWRAWRRGATEPARVACFGWCWLLLALIPASLTGPHLFMIGDRYAYLPVIGLFVFFHGMLTPAFGWLESRWGKSAHAVVAAVFVLAGIGQAWALVRRTGDWTNDHTLAEASVRAHPNNPYALYVLGYESLESEDLVRADALLARAEQGNPKCWRTPNAICVLRLRQRRLAEAMPACQRSIALHPGNPRAWANLAAVHVHLKQWEQALEAARQSVQLKPHYAEGCYLAAVSAANLARMAEAEVHLHRGLQEDPAHRGLLELQRAMNARRRR